MTAYLIRYQVDYGKFGPEERTPNQGLTHKLVVLSGVTDPEDGDRYSQFSHSYDGDTMKPMQPLDLMRAWVLMAADLAEHPEMPEAERMFCRAVFDSYCQAVMGGGPKPSKVN